MIHTTPVSTAALVLLISLLPSATICAEDCDGNGIDDSLELEASLHSTWSGSGHEIQVPAFGLGLAVLDITGDNILDVLATSGSGGAVLIFEGQGDGSFYEPFEIENLFVRRPIVADLDKNGQDDLVFHTAGGLRIAFDAHWSTLGGPADIEVSIRTGFTGADFEVVDYNRDGLLDIVAAVEDGSHGVNLVYINDGARGFESDAGFSLFENIGQRTDAMEMEFGDFDGNSSLDFARRLLVHFGHGERLSRFSVNGEPKEVQLVSRCNAFSQGDTLRAIDTDRDGKDELIHVSSCGAFVFSYTGSEFTLRQEIEIDGSGSDITSADFDRDGNPDFSIATKRGVLIYYGNELGQFAPGPFTVVPTDDFVEFVDSVAADIDGDGELELLVGTWPRVGTTILTVLQPRGPGDRDGNGQLDICEGTFFRRGDANGDGHVDVSDSLAILGYLFLGTRAPSCLDAADTDDNGRLELTDGHLVNVYLFLGGFSMPPPGPSLCLGDPSPDDLGCLTSNCH